MGSAEDLDIDVLVVGAGFGGCYLLNLLRKLGLSVKVFEAGSTLGGVWCWNRYPGARVDCELPYYGYSDPAVWNTWVWKERFPDHSELRRYFRHVDKVWDLSKDISLHTRVTAAQFVDDHWLVQTEDGRQCKCKWFLAATGTSFKHYVPDWKGKDSFKGQIHHSSLWPEDIDMTGKRVAVIGAGSTGVQIMQEAGKVASAVTQFIKTPNIAVPMRQQNITVEEIYRYKNLIPFVFKACRTTRGGLAMDSNGRMTFDDTEEQRQATWEEQWSRGGFNWVVGCYMDTAVSKEANRAAYDFWAKKTRARISDPKKRDLLAPIEPPYYFLTKRPSLEQDYYEQCDKPHVEITDSPILEIKETGILTKEKFQEFDIIAIATGYDAVTGGLRHMGIKDRNGVDLHDKWENGVTTHLGMMVHGYPNMYIVYGPQAPTSLTNGPPFIEMQCEWIRDVIAKQLKEGHAIVEASKDAEDAWRKTCLELANRTLAIHTSSWYMGANIPGKKREYLLYMGGIPAWHKACTEALEGWKGFDVASAA